MKFLIFIIILTDVLSDSTTADSKNLTTERIDNQITSKVIKLNNVSDKRFVIAFNLILIFVEKYFKMNK